jgi:uncharacterized cupin superfamily protein
MSDNYLVTADQIAAMDAVTTTHSLNPGATRSEKSLGDATGLTGLGIYMTEVAPGEDTTTFHMHHHEDEAIYVLAGTGTARIGEATHSIGPGDFIGYRKGGRAHVLTNTGTETLRYLVIGERRAHDVCDYPERGKRLYRMAGLPDALIPMSVLSQVVTKAEN